MHCQSRVVAIVVVIVVSHPLGLGPRCAVKLERTTPAIIIGIVIPRPIHVAVVPFETARHQRVKEWGGMGISDGYQAG